MLDDTIAPRDQIAALTRATVEEMHSEWDSPNQFVILVCRDNHVEPRLVAVITGDVPIEDYPKIMAGLAEQDIIHMIDGGTDVPPCAYLFQYEAFGLYSWQRDAMTPQQQAQFDEDLRNRNLDKRDDREESARAICVDVHGRIYKSAKRRLDDSVEDEFFEPMNELPGAMDDAMITRILRATALATGMAYHKLPGPTWMYN